jgi:acyl carrier protein
MRELDKRIRHRLRAVQPKQWQRGATMIRALRRLGAGVNLTARIAGNARSWWRNSSMGLNMALPIAYFDRLGVPPFALPQLLETAGAGPHAGWCGRGPVSDNRSPSRFRPQAGPVNRWVHVQCQRCGPPTIFAFAVTKLQPVVGGILSELPTTPAALLSTDLPELESELAALFVQALNLETAAADINPAASLFGDGLGLDSIDILEVALEVSHRYGFQLRSDDENNHQIFQSLRSLAAHVAQHRTK